MDKRKRTHSYSMMMSGQDRITNLHPSILCHILSRLSTKQAVRTSILSKKWKCKWKTSYTLNLYFFGHRKDNEQRFQKFAEKMLLVSPIRNVVFCYGCVACERGYDSVWAEKWISTLLRHNTRIESLNLKCAGIFTVPHSLLSTNSLRRLQLELRCSYRVPPQIFFPNLKHLCLHFVHIQSESSDNDILTFTLPLVEKVELSCCWVNVKSVTIYAPELTTFWYIKPLVSKRNNIANDIPIEIVGTKLATVHCSGLPKNLITSGSNIDLVLSDLDRLPERSELLVRIRRLLEGVSCLRNLQLSKFWLTAITQSGFPLQIFDHLTRLVLLFPGYSETLIRLLHATPILKFLKIQMSANSCVDSACDAVKSVPSCISLHLEELVIGYYHSTAKSARIVSNLEKVEFDYLVAQDEVFNLPKFFIKHGVSLKKVHFTNVFHMKFEDKLSLKIHSVKYSRTTQDSEFSIMENGFKYEGGRW